MSFYMLLEFRIDRKVIGIPLFIISKFAKI
jgi:hypothetical protein